MFSRLYGFKFFSRIPPQTAFLVFAFTNAHSTACLFYAIVLKKDFAVIVPTSSLLYQYQAPVQLEQLRVSWLRNALQPDINTMVSKTAILNLITIILLCKF